MCHWPLFAGFTNDPFGASERLEGNLDLLRLLSLQVANASLLEYATPRRIAVGVCCASQAPAL
jgi:hypothetical protein